MRLYIILFLIFSLFSITAYGQSGTPRNPTPAPSTTNATPAPEPERYLNKNLKTQIFEIKHRDPSSLVKVLRGLSSDDKGTQLTPDSSFNTITVRDYAENITVMERAIAKLDVPPKVPANLEIQLHVIAASRSGKEKGQVPKNLEDVLTQLQNTLQYGSYRHITGILNRVQDGRNVEATGSTDPISPTSEAIGKASYSYFLRDVELGMNTSGEEIIQINNFAFAVKSPLVVTNKDGKSTIEYREASINTSLSLKEGEKIVVGTANIGSSDDAIILVITAKKVK